MVEKRWITVSGQMILCCFDQFIREDRQTKESRFVAWSDWVRKPVSLYDFCSIEHRWKIQRELFLILCNNESSRLITSHNVKQTVSEQLIFHDSNMQLSQQQRDMWKNCYYSDASNCSFDSSICFIYAYMARWSHFGSEWNWKELKIATWKSGKKREFYVMIKV